MPAQRRFLFALVLLLPVSLWFAQPVSFATYQADLNHLEIDKCDLCKSVSEIKVLTRYGTDDGTAYRAFLNESQKRSPPLDNSELSQIWNGTVAYYNIHIKTSTDYISPDLYSMGVPKIHFELPIADYKARSTIVTVRKEDRYFNIEIGRNFLKAVGITIKYNDMSHDYKITAPTTVISGENRFELLATILEDTIIKLAYKRGRKAVIYGALDIIANENHYHSLIDLLKKEP